MKAVADASVLACAFFPDEAEQDKALALLEAHATGRLSLIAPTLLPHEIANSVLKALRRGRMEAGDASAALARYQGLAIPLAPVRPDAVLAMAREHGCTAYDAAYMVLAQAEQCPLITADIRLCNAVGETLRWVIRLSHWPQAISLDTDLGTINGDSL